MMQLIPPSYQALGVGRHLTVWTYWLFENNQRTFSSYASHHWLPVLGLATEMMTVRWSQLQGAFSPHHQWTSHCLVFAFLTWWQWVCSPRLNFEIRMGLQRLQLQHHTLNYTLKKGPCFLEKASQVFHGAVRSHAPKLHRHTNQEVGITWFFHRWSLYNSLGHWCAL